MDGKRSGSIQGIKNGYVILTHLLFMDDIMLFSNGSEKGARRIHEILNIFYKATRMEVNAQKYSFSFSELREEVVQRLATLFPNKIIYF
jgi:hypothetical protein